MRDLDLADVAAFVQVAETGGITAAARVLQAPKSSVSRRVTRLERRLGTALLRRTTRAVTLTDAGRAFHRRAAAALAEIADAAGAAFDAREVPRGAVRLTAPPDVGAEVLPALVASFVAAHPHVRVDLDLSATPPGPLDGGYDLALRAGPPPGPGLRSAVVQDTAFRAYAAPSYLDRAGSPRTGAELAGHDCVLLHADGGRARWRLVRPAGPGGAADVVDVVVRGPVTANDAGVVARAAVAGAGIALLPRLLGEAAVAAGALRPVLAGYETAGMPLHLAWPDAAHVPLAVRALRDHLVRHFPR